MSRSDRHSTIKVIKKGTLIFICATLIISLPTILLWLLGVPGVQNEYARGWALGLKTLYHYIIGCVIILPIYGVVEISTQKLPILIYLNIFVVTIFWLFFSYSLFNLAIALEIIISSS